MINEIIVQADRSTIPCSPNVRRYNTRTGLKVNYQSVAREPAFPADQQDRDFGASDAPMNGKQDPPCQRRSSYPRYGWRGGIELQSA